MKRLIILFTTTLFAFSFSATAQSSKNDKMDKAYKATYSSDFKMGNAKLAGMIRQLWIDWDENMLDRNDYFADTIKAYFADGSMVNGKAAFVAESKKYRGGFTTVKSTIHAIIPIRSQDKNEDIVCMWGDESSTKADGTTTTSSIHEVWFFNKDGKITTLRQWTAKPTVTP